MPQTSTLCRQISVPTTVGVCVLLVPEKKEERCKDKSLIDRVNVHNIQVITFYKKKRWRRST